MDKKDVARVRTRSTEIDHFPNALHILWYGGGGKHLAFRPSSGVYEENSCVRRAEITKLLLLKHHLHNYIQLYSSNNQQQIQTTKKATKPDRKQ